MVPLALPLPFTPLTVQAESMIFPLNVTSPSLARAASVAKRDAQIVIAKKDRAEVFIKFFKPVI
ncbi:hypothetical protein D3C76_1849370 [compost metagenome]